MNFLHAAQNYIALLESKRESLLAEVKAKEDTLRCLSILSPSEPISSKMRTCFYLRTTNTDRTALALLKVASTRGESVLLRHEAAYCLGQMKRTVVIKGLEAVLLNSLDDDIVRHECAEALGSIGDVSCIPVLEQVASNVEEPREVRETCEIALDRFKDVKNGFATSLGEEDDFNTVDPAIVLPALRTSNVIELEGELCDLDISLYQRYKAMFSLRSRSANGKSAKEREDAVLALCRALLDTNQGPLFRHEVAFVLGQISHPSSVPSLAKALADLSLHDMVRHECAEALGGVGSEEAIAILHSYLSRDHEAVIVKESCEVALDAVEYWKAFGSSE